MTKNLLKQLMEQKDEDIKPKQAFSVDGLIDKIKSLPCPHSYISPI